MNNINTHYNRTLLLAFVAYFLALLFTKPQTIAGCMPSAAAAQCFLWQIFRWIERRHSLRAVEGAAKPSITSIVTSLLAPDERVFLDRLTALAACAITLFYCVKILRLAYGI